jgi:hypothetical protein
MVKPPVGWLRRSVFAIILRGADEIGRKRPRDGNFFAGDLKKTFFEKI